MRIAMLKLCSILACLTGFISLSAQERQLGTWKVFNAYHNSQGAADAGDKVYAASVVSVYSYDKASGAIQLYDKSNGLSDIGVKEISYDAESKYLAIIYNNTNIDFIHNGTDIYNLPDIKRQNTSGSVTIHGVSYYAGRAFLSSDLGISVVNLAKMEVSNTYVIGNSGQQVPVYSTTCDGNFIYAATDTGIKYAPYSSPFLQDFNTWHTFDTSTGITTAKANLLAAYNQKVYAVISADSGDALYSYNGTRWTQLYYRPTETFSSLNVADGKLFFSIFTNNSSKLGKIDANDSMEITQAPDPRPVNWFEANGSTWMADAYSGLLKQTNGATETIVPDGPFTNRVFRVEANNGVLNVASGGVDDSWGYLYNQDGMFIYKDNKWTFHNLFTDPALDGYTDVLCVASVPAKGKTYFGSFFSGLIELDDNNGSLNLINQYNSPLEGDQGDPTRTKISALTADRYGNLWIGNAGATHPFKVLKADNTWASSFLVSYPIAVTKRILIDQNDQVWAPLRSVSGGGLLVYNYNNTLDDVSDDVSRVLKIGEGSGNLPDNECYSLIEDKDGNIWVGTAQGIAIFYCSGSVLSSSGCEAEQIKVTLDGYVGYLFGHESVRALAVDAANRKWVGTTNGVWLVSADGQTELLRFTQDNSPLPSNLISDIQIDPSTGEVFIATAQGLVSYQGDAVDTCIGCKEALVYPNPVKPGYTGPIAIKDLADNAYVKITDAAGVLVYQGRANGTQMIWDGKGYKGTRAKSGVYLVFSSTDLGKQRRVAKILITN